MLLFALFLMVLQNDHTCEYMYSVELSQFSGGPNDPITVTATVQIACESSELYRVFYFAFNRLSVL